MDPSNGINGDLLENTNSPIDEILQSIFGNDEEDSRIISLNEFFSESTGNGNESNSHYIKRTSNSIQSSNPTVSTSNSNQISSPSYLEYSSRELTIDNNHQPDPFTNSISTPIASIPPHLTYQTLPEILFSDHKNQPGYVGMKRK